MAAKRAFSYIRMSTDIQLQGSSLLRQTELAKAYADKHGLELVEDLRDIGYSAHSGEHVKRGKLGWFLDQIDQNNIKRGSALLVESLDRLSREKPTAAFSQFTNILSHGIEIHTIFDGAVYTQETVDQNPGQLFTSIGFMLRAHSESEEKSKRGSANWQIKRQNIADRKLTSNGPKWLELKADRTEFSLLEGPASTVRKIFELCIEEGMGGLSIARFLNSDPKKYPKFTLPRVENRENGPCIWYDSYVKKILTNPATFGQFQPYKTVVVRDERTGKPTHKRQAAGNPIQGYYPEVVSKGTFDLAQARMAERKRVGAGRRGSTFPNIFVNLLVCGKCGSKITYRDKGSGPKGGRYLTCSNAVLKARCDSPGWKYEQFEKSFFEFVSEIALKEIFLDDDATRLKTSVRNAFSINSKRLNDKQTEYMTLQDRLADPNFSSNLLADLKVNLEARRDELTKLEATLESLRSQLADIESRQSAASNEKLLDAIQQLTQSGSISNAEKKHVRRRVNTQIKTIIESVTLHNNSGAVPSWEIRNHFSPRLLDYIRSKIETNLTFNEIDFEGSAHSTATEAEVVRIERYLDSDHGRRLIAHSERHFVVKFRNGTSRIVHPASSATTMVISNQMAVLQHKSETQ